MKELCSSKLAVLQGLLIGPFSNLDVHAWVFMLGFSAKETKWKSNKQTNKQNKLPVGHM